MWHQVENIKHETTGDISAECRIPQDSQWFLGHFPGKPILPGIAQLAMVRETVNCGTDQMTRSGPCRHANDNRIRFSRIKFKKMVEPGEHLNILVSPKKKQGVFTFRITVDGVIACSGNLTLAIDSPDS